ncbi:DNA-binding protein WhiA [Ureaplasma zalophigenitalium]|uniref:DNA-binding protein WhiA n=1 Tax=Ureaplasma zalophigenitalium TaxID=907723 RepID=A0ABT3BPR7_9BACT|nr:DNA-binding protein WhiA [Ureaplasma zalophigenitalium]MCV3754262.1 DNA-binding protein WhiA [Ureaplasma zalophigenitalium]
MSENKASFNYIVRDEIISNKHSIKDLSDIIYAITLNFNTHLQDTWVFNFHNQSILDFLVNSIADLKNSFHKEFDEMQYSLGYNKKNEVQQVVIYHGVDKLSSKLKWNKLKVKDFVFDDLTDEKNKNRIKAQNFIIGAFLGYGYLNDPSKVSNLQIRVYNDLFADIFLAATKSFGLEFKYLKSTKKTILYLKKREAISDFLKILKTNFSYLRFEDIRVVKDYTNNLTRLENINHSNTQKLAKLAGELKVKIDYIMSKRPVRLAQASPAFQKYCQLRRDNFVGSLNEIVEKLQEDHHISISKSGLNHFNRKIKLMFDEIVYEEENK